LQTLSKSFGDLFPSQNGISRTNVHARDFHVPVNLVFVHVADGFGFKVAEKVDDGFYRAFDVPGLDELFDAITSFTGADEDDVCCVCELDVVVPDVETDGFGVFDEGGLGYASFIFDLPSETVRAGVYIVFSVNWRGDIDVNQPVSIFMSPLVIPIRWIELRLER
jgi:hypothetical protein